MSDARASEPEPRAPGQLRETRLGVVNGLRGVAILVVLYHHLVSPFLTPFGIGLRKVHGVFFSPYSPLVNGWLGVNLFFILSGFVLALPYEQGSRAMNGPRDAWTFYVRRGKRLLPLYYFVILAGLFTQTRARWPYMGTPLDVLGLLTFTFIGSPAQFLPSFDFALWSLGVEVGFSLLLPLLLWIERRAGIRALTVGAFLFALAVRIYGTATRVGLPSQLDVLKDGPFGRLDDFVLGMAICRAMRQDRIPRGALAVGSVLAGFLLVFASGVLWDNIVLGSPQFTYAAFANDLTNVGCGLVLLGLLGSKGVLRTLVTSPPLQLFGMMCYSIYAWHVFGLTLRGPPWALKETPYVLLVTVLFSAATYRYIEFPGRSLRALFAEFPR